MNRCPLCNAPVPPKRPGPGRQAIFCTVAHARAYSNDLNESTRNLAAAEAELAAVRRRGAGPYFWMAGNHEVRVRALENEIEKLTEHLADLRARRTGR